jgi:hypothetical protein
MARRISYNVSVRPSRPADAWHHLILYCGQQKSEEKPAAAAQQPVRWTLNNPLLAVGQTPRNNNNNDWQSAI